MSQKNLKAYLLHSASSEKWKIMGPCKRAGVLVPLFSVYSQDSVGIGDLNDLKLLIDWCHKTGNSILQLLPLNEVGSIFCPYDSLSSFALEPMYIFLEVILSSKDKSRTCTQVRDKSIQHKIDNLKKLFPCQEGYVDYGIKQAKLNLLREIYALEKEKNTGQLTKFQAENAYWLLDFSLFKVLKHYYQDKPWYEWEDKFRNRRQEALEEFRQAHEEEINFEIWVQWQLYKQFKDVKAYAEAKKVLLKGDLPILVSRDSADVWAHPELFKLEFAAGAPPDMYAALGQRWGMPTYNWEKIRAERFRYLKEKLKFAENFYDILRIDHVVGLFRIWSIPYDEPLENQGLNGFFDPPDKNKWLEQGRNILSVMLENTQMLLCAEDLGVIPEVCTETLKKLGIPGCDVQRWMKDWKLKHDFLKPKDYRLLSVAMLSTHDTTNWPAWWENEAGTTDEGLFMRRCSDHRKIGFDNVKDKLFDLARSGRGRLRWLDSIDSVKKLVSILGKKKEELADFIDFYQNSFQEREKLWKHLDLEGPMREKCDSDILRTALKITLDSSAIFCINTIIDYLYLADIFKGDPYSYRINTPGTISKNNWSLVIPISLGELLSHKINKEIRDMIVSSRRT